MRFILASRALVIALSCLAGAAEAQERSPGAGETPEPPQSEPPGDALEQLLAPGGPLDRLAEEAREALRTLRREANPWTDALGAIAENPDAYEPPTVLPNGDILIRRRDDVPPAEPDLRDAPPNAPASPDDTLEL